MWSLSGRIRYDCDRRDRPSFVLVVCAIREMARPVPLLTTMTTPFRRSCEGAATTVTVATMAVVPVHLPSTCVIGNRIVQIN